MVFYKVIKDDRVIDVLDQLIFLKYQPKHKIMILCEESDAQAILSSDKNHIWHELSLYKIPVSGYDTVKVEEIDKYEYNKLKVLNLNTPEEIMDAYTMELIGEINTYEDGKSLFVNSLKRLYINNFITQEKVIAMYDKNHISNDDKEYILGKE